MEVYVEVYAGIHGGNVYFTNCSNNGSIEGDRGYTGNGGLCGNGG